MTLPLENTLVASKDKKGKSTPAKKTGEKTPAKKTGEKNKNKLIKLLNVKKDKWYKRQDLENELGLTESRTKEILKNSSR